MSEQDFNTQLDVLTEKHQTAYVAFKAIYEMKSPPPQPPKYKRESLFIPVALLIMIVASVIVSGSRTIMEFGGDFIGVMAFVMLEGAIVTYAFFHTQRSFNERKLENVKRLASFGLALAFVVAVAANVHAVLKSKGIQTSEWINTGILILVSISAPTLAVISGEILAIENMGVSVRQRKIEEKYQADMVAYREGLNAAWSRQAGKLGAKFEINEPQFPTYEARPMLSDPDKVGRTEGQTVTTRDLLFVHLDDYPDDVTLTVRELAEKLGRSKSTVATALKEYKNRQA